MNKFYSFMDNFDLFVESSLFINFKTILLIAFLIIPLFFMLKYAIEKLKTISENIENYEKELTKEGV